MKVHRFITRQSELVSCNEESGGGDGELGFRRFGRYKYLLPLFLAAVVIFVYWPVKDFDFQDYDDNIYITENRTLQQASPQNLLIWAFTDFHTGHWHPLTWMSHWLDWRLFGPEAGGHHWTNVIIHIMNSLLLYLIFLRMSAGQVRSVLIALVFAVHPLNVESVAWIAERKNVLSACLGFLTVAAYLDYARKPSRLRYAALFLIFLTGLLAKPMLVTLPVLLLLLDFWPLGRVAERADSSGGAVRSFCGLLYEKVPLFILSTASLVITLLAAQGGGALRSLGEMPPISRLMNVFLAYTLYLKKFFIPTDLAFYYPYPSSFHLGAVIFTAAVFIAMTAWVIQERRCRPYLLVGWSWFVVMLLPVIGIVQVGFQSMADRYAYLPMVGLLIMIAWGVPEILARIYIHRVILLSLTGLVIAAAVIASRQQLATWRDSYTLAQRAFAVTEENHMAHLLMGNIMYERKNLEGAAFHYREALRDRPHASEIHNNLGNVYFSQGRYDAAFAAYEQALCFNPRNEKSLNNLGVISLVQGRREKAMAYFQEALRIDPFYPSPRRHLQTLESAKEIRDSR